MTRPSIYIGIDTGVNTGIAIWESKTKQFISIESVKIHEAMATVNHCVTTFANGGIVVRVEDARKRKWFGETGKEKAQGVGSIKRDAVIWEDFLTGLGCEFQLVAPKNNKTKLSAVQFKQYTSWVGKTNEHGRDAAMLVYGF